MISIFSIASGHGEHAGNVAATMTNRMLMEENKRLQEQVNEGRKKIQNLAKQLSAASADVAKSVRSVAKYDSLEETLRECSEERDRFKCDLTKSLREKEDMNVLIRKLQKQIQDMENTHQREIQTSNEKNEALKSLLDSVSAKAVQSTSQKEAAESKVVVLQGELKEMERKQQQLLRDFKILSDEKVETAKQMSALRSNIQANQQLQKQMESKVATLAYEKQTLERDFKTLGTQHQHLIATKHDLVATIALRDKTIVSRNERIQYAESENARKMTELERLGNKLGMVSHSHDMALAEIEELKESLMQTQIELEKKRAELEQTKQELLSQLEESSKQKDELANDLKTTIENLMATREEVASLKDDVADRDKKIEEEKKKLSELGCSEKVQVLAGVGTITSITESYF